MSSFCLDRDILSIEPVTFLGEGFVSVRDLIVGTDGVLAATTFTSAGADFIAANVQAGMILTTTTTTLAEGSAWEILSVDSATQLTVSVLRSSVETPAIAPPAGTSLIFRVRSLAARIYDVSDMLAEKLRQLADVAGVDSADFADADQLRRATACGVLADAYLARAETADADDINWIKAEHYRREFAEARNRLRLEIDGDGDGEGEQVRTIGNMTLRRV